MRYLIPFAVALLAAACVEDDDALSTPPVGTWAITWTFDGWYIQGHNPIPTDIVEIGESSASYGGCLECGAEHEGAVIGSCFVAPAGADRRRPRDAYELCVDGDSLNGVIHWEALYDGERDQIWTVRGQLVTP